MIPGLDMGNTRMKVSIPDATGNPQLLHNEWGEPFTPSVVYFAPGGQVIVGSEAESAIYLEPERVVKNWKRFMGTDKVLYEEGDKQYRARDILAILLKHTRKQIEAKNQEPVDEVVICIPANYKQPQRQDTLDAAEQASLKVLRLIEEPTAAALGNGIHKKNSWTALIYDLGGGTFDVSVVKSMGNSFEILATGGEQKLGGQDFNAVVRGKALDAFQGEHGVVPDRESQPVFYQDLDNRIEQVKTQLSIKDKASLIVSCEGKLLNMTITRTEFEEWCKPLVEKTIERTLATLKEGHLSIEQIDEVIAVGGGAMMPVVQKALEKALGKTPSRQCEPHYAASFGAVWAGRIECQRQNRTYMHKNVALPPPQIYMQEFTSHTIGVCVLNESDQLVCSEMLPKHTRIPSRQVRMFKMLEPNQTEVMIELLQGPEGQNKDACALLGSFNLVGLPPIPEITPRIEISFHLDINGMLTAKALDSESGKSQELQVEVHNGDGQAA